MKARNIGRRRHRDWDAYITEIDMLPFRSLDLAVDDKAYHA